MKFLISKALIRDLIVVICPKQNCLNNTKQYIGNFSVNLFLSARDYEDLYGEIKCYL